MELVYMDGRKEPYTTHDIIAEHAEIENISVRKLIEKHKKDLEVLEVLSFEIHKPEKGSLGGLLYLTLKKTARHILAILQRLLTLD